MYVAIWAQGGSRRCLSLVMVRVLRKRPAAAPRARRRRACIDNGSYALKRGVEERVEWFLIFEDREPWQVDEGSACNP